MPTYAFALTKIMSPRREVILSEDDRHRLEAELQWYRSRCELALEQAGIEEPHRFIDRFLLKHLEYQLNHRWEYPPMED